MQAARFLQVPPKSSFKKLVLSTTLWQHAKIRTTFNTPDRLKDSEWKIGQLSSWLPVPYIPLTDLITTKEAPESLKIKLPDEPVFNMSTYSHGNTKEYLKHVVTVLCLILQKGLDLQNRKLDKAIIKLTGMYKDFLKIAGSKTTILLDDDVEAHKLEIKETQKMLQEAQKQHNKAIAKTYELLRNLLSSDPQSQFNCFFCKMHKRDLWAGVNGQVIIGRCPQMWATFRDCLELHKLTVFTADTAKRQQFYIQQAVCKPQRVS
jgi:hypothetical protein